MQKKRFSIQSKLTIGVILLGLALALIISVISYYNSKDELENQYATRVVNAARSAAGMISSDEIAEISAAGGDKTATYAKVQKSLNGFREANGAESLIYLYLIVPDANGMRVLSDTYIEGVDNIDWVMPYDAYSTYEGLATDENGNVNKETVDSYLAVYNAFAANSYTKEPRLTDNEYGYMYGAAASITDADGKAVAIVSTTVSMGEVQTFLNNYLYTIVGLSTLTIAVLIFLFAIYVRRSVVKPIIALKDSTAKVTQRDEKAEIKFSDFVTEVKTRDEVGDLANTFNYMLRELDLYIDDLQSVTKEKERIGAELNVATKIQSSMLPCIFPPYPDRKEFDIYASMLPAKEVGGDFYDFFLIDNDHLGVVIADVSGKGVPAALFMVIAKTLIKNEAQSGKSPAEIYTTVNNQLCETNDAGMFVTSFMGILEISTGKFTYVNAGHNHPLLRRANGDFDWLIAHTGFVLAGMPGMKYKEESTTLGKGDTVYMYTDGVTEATNAHEELFSDPRLLESANKSKDLPLHDLLVNIKNDIDTFVNGADQFDDITMIAFRIN